MSQICLLITVMMLIVLQHQRRAIPFDSMGPSSARLSYVYIMGFEETVMNIYATLQLNPHYEMKYCAARGLFALRHKSKSTYCSLHTDRSAAGWNLRAAPVHV